MAEKLFGEQPVSFGARLAASQSFAALFRDTANEMIDTHLAMTPEERTKAEAHGLNMLSAMCDAKDELDGKSQLTRAGTPRVVFCDCSFIFV